MNAPASSRALYLQGAGDPLFAFLHTGAAPQRETAVLLCPPFGWEDMCSYRIRREWAERLALDRLHGPSNRSPRRAATALASRPTRDSWTRGRRPSLTLPGGCEDRTRPRMPTARTGCPRHGWRSSASASAGWLPVAPHSGRAHRRARAVGRTHPGSRARARAPYVLRLGARQCPPERRARALRPQRGRGDARDQRLPVERGHGRAARAPRSQGERRRGRDRAPRAAAPARRAEARQGVCRWCSSERAPR